MQAYRVKKKVSEHGKIQLEALPFAKGEIVEIIVLATSEVEKPEDDAIIKSTPRSLKGSVLEYAKPTEPVAQDEWISAR